MRHLVLIAVILTGLGCSGGPSRPAQDLDRGRQALTLALEAWKKNDSAALTLDAEPVTFSEEWRRTLKLSSYELGAVTVPDERTMAYTVTLTVKDRKGKDETRVVTYLVELTKPIRILRDPYN